MSEGVVRLKSATVVIAAVTALVSLPLTVANGLDPAAAVLGFIPARVSGLIELGPAAPVWLTPLTATLVHGGYVHLLLNLVMLVWVGSQIERVLGASSLILAYLIGAFVASAAQWLADPSAFIPMVGASGAISSLFGIYALLAARPKPLTRSPPLNRAIHAAWLLAAWVVIQWMTQMLAGGQGVMLATPAHIGGFIAGLLLQRPLLLWRYRGA
ncbi:MAG: rhomboid family intramembrane serine protease [Pseudomonadota bacterium]|nr:rhomboid family intramembrane serine protease [Pseudomonadota bacterium]